MPGRTCPECSKDLDATNTSPKKHAIRHWGDIDLILEKDPKAENESTKRIKTLLAMEKSTTRSTP